MRTLTGQDTAVLSCPDGYSVAARVWVWDGSGWVDVTALEDRDWLVEVSWDEAVDEPCAQATVQLRRQLEDFSLNPLVSNKLTGLLALGRAFYIEAATVPLGDTPGEADWREVFRGQVETLNLENDPLVFSGRDDAGKLMRAYIETEAEYGSDAGTSFETILQSILSDNSTGVTLYTPTATTVMRRRFKQKKAPVLAAIREQVLKIGWDVRQWWDNGTGTFRFTLMKPDRLGAVGSVWSFAPAQVKSVTRLEQSLDDIRNAVRLYYYNRAALDASGKPTLASVTAEDTTSITAYGRMYMQLAEDEDSPIDSATEAQRMADAARDDLKDPLLDMGVEVGFHYGIQLGDMLTFEADDVHFSADQTLAVVSAEHRIGRRGHRTSLRLRGKPAGAHKTWLLREGRVNRQPLASGPDAVSGLTATATTGGAVITFTPPAVPPLPKEYEVHVSTTSGFTPSASTYRMSGPESTFDVTGLTPGTTYYAKVVAKDAVGNRSSVSSQVTVSPLPVQARSFPTTASYAGSLLINGDFEEQSNPSAPPDRVTVTSGVWGTNVTTTSGSYSGTRALQFMSSSNATVVTNPVSIRAGLRYMVDAYVRGTSGRTITIHVDSLDGDFATITSTSLAKTFSTTETAYSRLWSVSDLDPAAKYARLRLVSSMGGTSGTIDVDSVGMFLAELGLESNQSPITTNGWNAYVSGGHGPPYYYRDASGIVHLDGSISGGTVGATAFTLPTGYRPQYNRDFVVASAGGSYGIVTVASNGVVFIGSGSSGLICLSGITFRAG